MTLCKPLALAMLLALPAAVPPLSAEDSAVPAKAAAPDAQLVKSLMDSAVIVQYRFKFDSGDDPVAAEPWDSKNANCNMAERTALKNCFEMPGYLLSNGEILTPDIMAPPRFIKSISILRAGTATPASLSGFNLEKGAAFLKPDGKIEASPLKFSDAKDAKPAKAVNYWKEGALWRVAAKKLAPEYVEFQGASRKQFQGENQSLIVAADGSALGFLMRDPDISEAGLWRGDPAAWPKDSPERLASIIDGAQRKAEASLAFVKLSFKLPPPAQGRSFASHGSRASQEHLDNESEAFGLGIAITPKKMLVITELAPDKLACLDSVKIAKANGSDEFDGVCVAFLKSLSGIVVEPKDQARSFQPPALSPANPVELLDKPVVLLLAKLYPELLAVKPFAVRVQNFEKSLLNFTAFRVPLFLSGSYEKEESYLLLADFEGRLLAAQLDARPKPRFNTNRYYSPSSSVSYSMLAFRDLAGLVSDPSFALPFTPLPDTLQRDPWLGVDVQEMTPALARANGVSQATRNGRFGAIVSNIAAGSPADKAGIKRGDILLKVIFDGDTQPIDIDVSEGSESEFDFPWAQLDSVPTQMLSRLPPPWRASRNPFDKFLAQAGAGRKYSLEILRDGKERRLDGLVAELGPEGYANAAKFELEGAGLTVKTLTYEARRYLKLSADAPGVIVSKLDPGGKAAIAGLKPFEVIVSIDGEPLHSVKDFERLSAGKPEIVLLVLRLAEERSVRIGGLPAKRQ